jgi:hypothetical protein
VEGCAYDFRDMLSKNPVFVRLNIYEHRHKAVSLDDPADG